VGQEEMMELWVGSGKPGETPLRHVPYDEAVGRLARWWADWGELWDWYTDEQKSYALCTADSALRAVFGEERTASQWRRVCGLIPDTGPCALCGRPEERHRVADAVLRRIRAGDTVAAVAADFGLDPALLAEAVGEGNAADKGTRIGLEAGLDD
jgi:hypothetical protein